MCNSCEKCNFFQFNKIDAIGQPRAPQFLFRWKKAILPTFLHTLTFCWNETITTSFNYKSVFPLKTFISSPICFRVEICWKKVLFVKWDSVWVNSITCPSVHHNINGHSVAVSVVVAACQPFHSHQLLFCQLRLDISPVKHVRSVT